MSFTCTFFCPGTPVGKGSKRAFLHPHTKKPIITDMSKGSKDWQNSIKQFAYEHRPEAPLEGPVLVDVTFVMPKPKSAPKTKRIWPIKRPDIDKLTRVVLDALTAAAIYRDDSQVTILMVAKDYECPQESTPGVKIKVKEIEAQ